jgi:hypothetical protein
MSSFAKTAVLLVALGGLTACDRSAYESEPVVLKHDLGPVVCQLYTAERLYWDEAIQVPEGMTQAEGNALCEAEGKRRKEALTAKAA